MQLSKIKYRDIIFHYSKDQIAKMVFSEDHYNPEITYDVAIVFGGVSMIPNRLDQAIMLYHQKKIKKILVSGGIGFLALDRWHKEAPKMFSYLIANNIPEEDIIMEDKSRNTNENIQNSLRILTETYDTSKINILLITSDFHLQRCTKLLTKRLKSSKVYGIGIKDGKNDLSNWQKKFSSKKNIYVEAFLLVYYAKHHKLDNDEVD